jgi:hypothetical protein
VEAYSFSTKVETFIPSCLTTPNEPLGPDRLLLVSAWAGLGTTAGQLANPIPAKLA